VASHTRLSTIKGLGADSATQIIAEVGATAAPFPSDKQLSSWVRACPGRATATCGRVIHEAANAAVKVKGSIFEIAYRRSVPRLGHNQTIGAIARRQCRLIC
jgi:transposase